MKKVLFSTICAVCAYTSVVAQGWIGNSPGTLYPVNSGLGLSPLSVGIGVTAPTEQLHTTAGVRFQGLTQVTSYPRIVVQDNTGVLSWADPASFPTGAFWSLTGNTGTAPGTIPGQNYLGTTDPQRLVIATNATERMTVLANGRVGIGTSAPTNRLEVIDDFDEFRDQQVGIGGRSVSIRLFDGPICPVPAPPVLGAPYAKIGLASLHSDFVMSSAPGDLIIQTIDTTASIIFSNRFSTGLSNGLEQMRLSRRGYLGIGITTPNSIVHAMYPGGISGWLDISGGWLWASDKRLKTNVQSISGAMDIVNKLNGVYYHWKTDKVTKRQIGFLAQDVQKVLPEVVSGTEGDVSKGEVLGMAYQNIVPVLVEALKEKDQQIVRLLERMDRLEQKLGASGAGEQDQPVQGMELKQNVPNPFASQTTVAYAIGKSGMVQVDLYDQQGVWIRTLVSSDQAAGSHQLTIDGSTLQPGAYIYTLKLDGKQLSKKAIKL